MVNVARVEATITAQSKLRPGLNQASGELNAFRRAQQKAFSVFGSAAARASTVAVQKHAAAMTAAQSRIAMASRASIASIAAPAALAASYKQFADVDRQISRIGVTANATQSDLAGVRKQIEGIAYETAQSAGNVTGGLDVLVAQGRTLKEGLEFLPSVARTAAASNSAIEDIAKTADSVSSNFKIAGKEMQGAFDIMAEGGKAGMFELKDMSRYLPSLGPAAAAIGMQGTKGLTELVSILQVMRKGSGTSEEAYSSMNNVLMKMDSDETRKNFKKFGIDSAAALDKTRKAGGNVIETFENLIKLATKGDNGKIGEIIKDAEFKRGVLALRAYEGEWQKLAKVISDTASGSVGRDLTKVTNDARAQLDRMFSAIENRSVQLGGFLAKNIVLPLDEALKRLERGENATANKVAESLHYRSANLIANQELDGATPGQYDPETRRTVDARKEFLTRQRYDAERERLGGDINSAEAKRAKIIADDEASRKGRALPASVSATLDARRKAQTDPLDSQISGLKEKLASLESLFQSLSEINTSLGQVEQQQAQASKPRFSRQPERPGFARVGSATTSFAPNLNGGGAVTSIEYGGVPISTTLPPVRPGSAGQNASTSGAVDSALGGNAPFNHERPPAFRNDTSKLPQNPRGNAASNSLFSSDPIAGQSLPSSLTKTKMPSFSEMVGDAGSAASAAGQALATGLSPGLEAMKAQVAAAVAEMQATLNSLKAPSLSLGGFNTGKGMAEVR